MANVRQFVGVAVAFGFFGGHLTFDCHFISFFFDVGAAPLPDL